MTLIVWCTRQKLYQAKCKDKAAFRFASFFEKAFVSRVKRRSCIRIVRFCRSTCDVEISHGFGVRLRVVLIFGHGVGSRPVDSLFDSEQPWELLRHPSPAFFTDSNLGFRGELGHGFV